LGEEFAAVGAGVGGDGVDIAFAEEIFLVIEGGDGGHVDAS